MCPRQVLLEKVMAVSQLRELAFTASGHGFLGGLTRGFPVRLRSHIPLIFFHRTAGRTPTLLANPRRLDDVASRQLGALNV